ncbi:MAG TPA: PaaI family thioesterase [Candidatus Dormibacteraeota bacterium]|nr:PaaI family thioesterase [Candidatus Dormibacteraeota bacterium]
MTRLSGKPGLREKLTRAELGVMARRLRNANTTKLFGFELRVAGGGRATIGMRVRSHHIQLHNVVHGGILCALADTTGAIAAYTTLPQGTHLATIELKINFLEPVAGGMVVARARVLRRGRNFIVSDCDIFTPGKVLAAKALMTFAIGATRPQS